LVLALVLRYYALPDRKETSRNKTVKAYGFFGFKTLILKKTMAQLQLEPVITGKKNRTRKAPLKIDMTPMVDLGFLLITFFIFTTTISEAHETTLYMPKEGPPVNIGETASLTVLLSDGDSVYYYQGTWEEALAANSVRLTNYDTKNGIGSIIRGKQEYMGAKRKELMLMIKPLDNSSYNNLMNSLDEVMINDVKKYTIMDVTEKEKNWVAQHSKR
jgi:biopolymer transport protein ExbD